MPTVAHEANSIAATIHPERGKLLVDLKQRLRDPGPCHDLIRIVAIVIALDLILTTTTTITITSITRIIILLVTIHTKHLHHRWCCMVLAAASTHYH